MSIKHDCEANAGSRFINHWQFAVTGEQDLRGGEGCPANLVEKAGDGILHVIGSTPRSIKWMGKQFQDPRVVTIALTIIALIVISFIFYPITSALIAKAACIFIGQQLAQIPLWTIRLAAYLLTCTTIVGYGARATGRFANADLMKAFYALPNYQGNPCKLTNSEIQRLRAQTQSKQDDFSI